MAIPEDDVARVRQATDIVALVGEHAGLKRQGRRFVGLCPFHQEKTPSFSVNAEEGVYYCFGCQASGDAITFVRATEHLDFVDAVRLLADRAGITITEDEAVTVENRKRAPLYKVMSEAVEWYHERLLISPDAGRARDYLRSRGYGGDLVRKFKLGWAPDEWDALARHLSAGRSSSATSKLMSDAGLGFVNRTGRTQDAFRARVLFPIFDPSGKAVAIGGRVLPASGGAQAPPMPKYKNSQETAIYSKRRVLYGMNWAKSDVIASGEVIVCEGYTDVIGFFSVGLPRAVATCGTALGEEHFRMLRNFATGRVVLAYDADAAGTEGASRVYTWERQHQVDVAVAALPVGSDPGELARTDPDALRAAVADAKPFLAFRLARIFESADLNSVEGRVKTADAALACVLEHPSELVRDQYLMEIADRCRMEAAALRARMQSLPSGVGAPSIKVSQRRAGSERSQDGSGSTTTMTRVRRNHLEKSHLENSHQEAGSQVDNRQRNVGDSGGNPGHPGAFRASEGSRPGLEALRLAVHEPDRIGERLERFLFIDELHARAFDALASAETMSQAIASVDEDDPQVATLLRRLTVEESAADADDCVVQLIRAAAHRSLVALQAEARLQPERVAEVAADAGQVALDLERIGTTDDGLEAADRLLAWLHRRETGA